MNDGDGFDVSMWDDDEATEPAPSPQEDDQPEAATGDRYEPSIAERVLNSNPQLQQWFNKNR